jgi:PAS domain S-box-containing protein
MEVKQPLQSLEAHLSKIAQTWVSNVLILGSFLFLLLGVMDFFTAPEHFRRFIFYRLAVSLVLLFLYFLNKLKTSKLYQYAIVIIATTVSALTVERMVLEFGGQHSTYYAGLNLVVICALGFIPINLLLSSVILLIIYGIYLLPLVLTQNLTDPVFLSNNFFMIATFIIALAWRYQNQKLIITEFLLREELAQGKYKLELYSNQLENLVTERTKELNKSEQWHRSLYENATDGIVVLDRNGIIVNANEKACDMHGFTKEALLGAHIKLLESEDRREQMAERLRRILEGESLVFETLHNKKDGSPIYLEISSKAITIDGEPFIQSFYRDISEKKKLQEHLIQSQKMESIGVLAGGIAHDFNNILTAILGHTEILRHDEELSGTAINSLNVIEEASRRAGRMISQLLGFARKSKYEFRPLNLNDVVYDTVKLLERIIDKTNSMSVDLDSHLPLIRGDINQIEQVIMNLIVNARDAMPKGGRISIMTAARTVAKDTPDVPPYVPPGEYVLLGVADTGIGIPDNIRNSIFEPFFTTKEKGKGTGLGLSTVYGAVKEHKGYISLKSEVGAGSVFTIYLPVSRTAGSRERKEPASSLNGRETLLIVDDEESILRSIQNSLTGHGYTVFAVNDAVEALNLFESRAREIAMVLTDIVMPRLDGREFIRRIKTINPETKILAVSGHANYIAEKEDIKNINGFLQKPFEAAYLLSTVRRILDAKSQDFISA